MHVLFFLRGEGLLRILEMLLLFVSLIHSVDDDVVFINKVTGFNHNPMFRFDDTQAGW